MGHFHCQTKGNEPVLSISAITKIGDEFLVLKCSYHIDKIITELCSFRWIFVFQILRERNWGNAYFSREGRWMQAISGSISAASCIRNYYSRSRHHTISAVYSMKTCVSTTHHFLIRSGWRKVYESFPKKTCIWQDGKFLLIRSLITVPEVIFLVNSLMHNHLCTGNQQSLQCQLEILTWQIDAMHAFTISCYTHLRVCSLSGLGRYLCSCGILGDITD